MKRDSVSIDTLRGSLSGQRGFSLIELLVVIAILAVLAAILFPVLSQAREKGRQTVCLNNQRQIAMTVTIYTQDHDGMLPEAAGFWGNMTLPPGTLTCPTAGKHFSLTYAYNVKLSGRALDTCYDPVHVMLTADAADSATHLALSVRDLTARHGGKVVAAFADTHVELRQPYGIFGVQFVFTSDRDGHNQIYMMDYDGSNVLRLTNDTGIDSSPNMSLDGSQVAFQSDCTGSLQLYRMDCDGSGVIRLTNGPATNLYPRFSPDGNQITFTSPRSGVEQIYCMNADGSNVMQITHDPAGAEYSRFSPDGLNLLFTSLSNNGQLCRVALNNPSQVTQLTNTAARNTKACYSPDGKKIAFTSYRDGGDSDIYLMDADGANQVSLTSNDVKDDSAIFTPDGKQITFTSNRDGHDNIYLMNSDGSGVKQLTTSGPIVQ